MSKVLEMLTTFLDSNGIIVRFRRLHCTEDHLLQRRYAL